MTAMLPVSPHGFLTNVVGPAVSLLQACAPLLCSSLLLSWLCHAKEAQ